MSINFSKRSCQLGGSINSRTEFHGDDEVPACDFTLSGLMLDADELCALLDDASAHDRIYHKKETLAEPVFKQIKSLVFASKYEGSSVQLVLGLNEQKLKIGAAKLARITLAPQTGGLTALSLQVQCTPEPEQLALLFAFMGKSADASIRFGREQSKAKAQPELPLDHAGSPEMPATAH